MPELAQGNFMRLLLRDLAPRTREVLERRYGLGGAEAETLEEIGEDLGVTRERVRQIERNGIAELRERKQSVLAPMLKRIERHVRNHGDLRAEQQLFDDFADEIAPNVLSFLLDVGTSLTRHRETDIRFALWSLDDARIAEAEGLIAAVTSRLTAEGQELEDESFWNLVREVARERRLDLTERARASWIGLGRNIARGPLGRWGLRHWPEITPRNVGDWALIVLRAQGEREPLHFSEIVRRINAMRRRAVAASARAARPAHPQTVHNELIRDDRFVLVGRGLYALREWGFEPGTVRDVIVRILREAKRPLAREDIIAQVASVRRVQRNTIVLNLQNRATFARTADGRYILRRA